MQLLYFWVGQSLREERFYIKNQGICLNGQYEVCYDPTKSYDLYFKKKNDYVSNFYKSDIKHNLIDSLTCIVGQNGAGKTSIIEIITDICNRGLTEKYDYQLLVIWKTEKNNQIEYKYFINQPEFERFDNCNNVSIDLRKTRPCFMKSCKLDESDVRHFREDLEQLTIINYSTLFNDSGYFPTFWGFYSRKKRIIDITTMGLLNRYGIEYKENYQNKNPNFVDCYKAMELKKQISFYRNLLNKYNLLSRFIIEDKKYYNTNILRDKISISPFIMRYDEMHKARYENEFKNIPKNTKSIGLFDFIDKSTKSFAEQLYATVNHSNEILWSIAFSYWLILIDTITMDKVLINKSDVVLPDLILFNSKDGPIVFIKNAIDAIKGLYVDLPNATHNIDNSFHNFSEFYELLSNIACQEVNLSKIVRLKENASDLLKLVDYYLDSKISMGFGEYVIFSYIPRLSSGEQNLLTLLSRLYDIFYPVYKDNKENENVKFAKNILLTIDEGETTFHPAWQKKYIYSLIDYVSELFSNCNDEYKLNLLITTNNPVLLSDVLLQDIVFLKDGKSISIEKETFGGEINSLFADAFFVSDGLMGNYAQKKLEPIIDFINNENISTTDINKNLIKEYKNIINHIGDIALKNYLLSLFERKVVLLGNSMDDSND